MEKSILRSIADALRLRMGDGGPRLGDSDLQIGLSLHIFNFFNRVDMESLVKAMKGRNDHAVVMRAPILLPIIGEGSIQDYLKSDQQFETGGMSGPQKPLIRMMAEEALRNFNRPKTK